MAKTTMWPGLAGRTERGTPNGSRPAEPGATKSAEARGGLRAVAALAVIVVGIGGGFLVYQRSAQRSPVLVVSQAVSQGQVIQAGDLQVASITPTSGVGAVSADSESSIVGRHAAMALAAGQLLVPGDLASKGTTLAPGQVEIGAALGPTQLPAEGVVPGETVEAVASPTSASADKATAGAILATATVMSVSHPGSGGSAAELVSLSVPAGEQTTVEAAAATSSLGVVRVPGSGR